MANLFSAKGALSSLAWGNRPRLAITSRPWRNRICTEAGAGMRFICAGAIMFAVGLWPKRDGHRHTILIAAHRMYLAVFM